ncbi:hypothetical protein LINPERHAP1_LOCUS6459, partial [Linum perenne]
AAIASATDAALPPSHPPPPIRLVAAGAPSRHRRGYLKNRTRLDDDRLKLLLEGSNMKMDGVLVRDKQEGKNT